MPTEYKKGYETLTRILKNYGKTVDLYMEHIQDLEYEIKKYKEVLAQKELVYDLNIKNFQELIEKLKTTKNSKLKTNNSKPTQVY